MLHTHIKVTTDGDEPEYSSVLAGMRWVLKLIVQSVIYLFKCLFLLIWRGFMTFIHAMEKFGSPNQFGPN